MSDVKTIKQGFIRSAVFMGVVGVILAIDTLTADALTNWFGVRPRNLWGLDGILFSPLLHGGLRALPPGPRPRVPRPPRPPGLSIAP